MRVFFKEASPTTMMNDTQGGVGSGGFDQGMAGDNQLTMSNMIKEFQGLKDKFKNEDEDECEFRVSSVLCLLMRCLVVPRLLFFVQLANRKAPCFPQAAMHIVESCRCVAVISIPCAPSYADAAHNSKPRCTRLSVDCSPMVD